MLCNRAWNSTRSPSQRLRMDSDCLRITLGCQDSMGKHCMIAWWQNHCLPSHLPQHRQATEKTAAQPLGCPRPRSGLGEYSEDSLLLLMHTCTHTLPCALSHVYTHCPFHHGLCPSSPLPPEACTRVYTHSHTCLHIQGCRLSETPRGCNGSIAEQKVGCAVISFRARSFIGVCFVPRSFYLTSRRAVGLTNSVGPLALVLSPPRTK